MALPYTEENSKWEFSPLLSLLSERELGTVCRVFFLLSFLCSEEGWAVLVLTCWSGDAACLWDSRPEATKANSTASEEKKREAMILQASPIAVSLRSTAFQSFGAACLGGGVG